MERKIGEIFEIDGEWYQCIVGNGCKNCAFNKGKCYTFTDNNDPLGDCCGERRTDKYSVNFKKLEKVGEPYMVGNKLIQRYKIYPTTCCINVYGWYYQNLDVKSWTIDIELKQTREDMEEKKQKLDDLVGLYSSAQITYKEFDKELKALYDKEEREKTLKPFSLEAAKQGKPVCTRDGRKARIICFDAKSNKPIIALVDCNGTECIMPYFIDGRFLDKGKRNDTTDLMMLPEKKEGWINICSIDKVPYVHCTTIYPTEADAVADVLDKDYIATVQISWEE